MSTSDASKKCGYCGGMVHVGVCPMVKAIEYQADGLTIKRVEFRDPVPYVTGNVQTVLLANTTGNDLKGPQAS